MALLTRPHAAEQILASRTGATRYTTALALAAVTLVTAPVGYLSMFGGFRAYDDEGSFLITLRDYLSGHPLLTPNNSYYGPFYYEVIGGLFKLLGIAPTNVSGRLTTLVIWLVASVLGAIAAYRLTRNLWLTLTAQLVTFCLLTALTQEPLATYGLIGLLLLGLVVAATFTSTRPRASALAIGAIVGALCMVKINVGAFAVLAVVFAWAAGLAPRWRRFALPAIAVVITAAPLLLMANLLDRGWVLELALLASLSAAAIAIAIASMPAPSRRPPVPATGWLILGGATVIALSLAVALAGGTRPTDVWNGMVVISVRFPQLFAWPVNINPAADVWAVLSLAACIAFARGRVAIPDLARVAAGLFILVSILLLPSSLFLLGLPLAWIATQGPPDEPAQYHRLLLPALAVMESLQAYPVAGTQLSMGALLMVPVGATVLNDGINGLRSRGSARFAPAALILAAVALVLQGFLATSQFAAATPLGLPGAESVRMQPQQAAQLRALVTAIDRDCSSFITFPGMNSFYVWTGQTPPTNLRYGVWWLIPDAVDQQAIVRRLSTRSRLCVVKNQAIIDFWAQGRPVPRQPVVDFIEQNFTDGGTYGDYQLLVQR
ncbi:MAG: hypothetical protein E6I71_10545 [Chloroflexi bacterium]|nr:MAG: hypothetical protein E6I71_10545 [Chloroflexota bacterium]